MASPTKKRIVLLGATGSIGENTLRVLRAHRDRFELLGVAAHRNAGKLFAICREFGVRHAALGDATAAAHAAAPAGVRLLAGIDGLTELATRPDADLVLVAVVGTAALRPTLAAIAARKTIALASKEILVLAGKFVMAAARASGSPLLPVDSEHNAVFQCLQGHRPEDVRRLVLTASGGAFRDWPLERLTQVTPADALKHPTWDMGPKVTVDAATMANKGLELIEARWLFGLRAEQCQAVLHQQSLAHCLVEFADGSMLTHLCPPSMTFPIQHALYHPERAQIATEPPLNLGRAFSLDFRPVDPGRYPLFRLAQEANAAGGIAPAVFNAANEVAVAAFLAGRMPFLAIPAVVENTLAMTKNFEPAALPPVLEADATARRVAESLLPASR